MYDLPVQVTDVLATTLGNNETMEGALRHLTTCHCDNTTDTDVYNTCIKRVEEITEPIMTSLASWVTDKQQEICTTSNNSVMLISNVWIPPLLCLLQKLIHIF